MLKKTLLHINQVTRLSALGIACWLFLFIAVGCGGDKKPEEYVTQSAKLTKTSFQVGEAVEGHVFFKNESGKALEISVKVELYQGGQKEIAEFQEAVQADAKIPGDGKVYKLKWGALKAKKAGNHHLKIRWFSKVKALDFTVK